MITDLKRRLFLKYILVNSTITTAICAGVITPTTAIASWPKTSFEATSLPDALNILLGSDQTTTRRFGTEIKARPHLDDGATQVAITITTTITNIDSITILATSNPTPLAANFRFIGTDVDSLTTRIKMEGKGEVIAIIKSGDRLFSKSTEVDFSSCGCG